MLAVPVQSFTPVLVMRSTSTTGSGLTGVATTRTHSAIDRVVLPDGQASAVSVYAPVADESPEKVLKGTDDAVTPPHAVDGVGALAVATPLTIVKPR